MKTSAFWLAPMRPRQRIARTAEELRIYAAGEPGETPRTELGTTPIAWEKVPTVLVGQGQGGTNAEATNVALDATGNEVAPIMIMKLLAASIKGVDSC